MMLRPLRRAALEAAPLSQLPASPGSGAVTPLFPPAPATHTASVTRRRMSLRALSFVAVVLLPVAIAAAYYFAIAADQ
jgi:hypothetical protein